MIKYIIYINITQILFFKEKIHKFLEQILQSQLEFILNKITEELVDFVANLEVKYQI